MFLFVCLGVLQVADANSSDSQSYVLHWHFVSVNECLVVEGCERSAFSLVPYVDEERIWFLGEFGGSQLNAINSNCVQLWAAYHSNHHHESRSAGILLPVPIAGKTFLWYARFLFGIDLAPTIVTTQHADLVVCIFSRVLRSVLQVGLSI